MIKVLQINVTANWGSTGRIAEGIGLVAQKAGYESWIAWGRRANLSRSHLIQIGKKIDYLEHGFESRIFDNHGLASRSATKQLIRQMEEIKPDIVHLHNIHGYYLNYPLLFEYLQRTGVPVVWTLHDCWPFTGHCVHFSVCGCDRWKTGCYHCPQKITYPISYLFDRSRKNYKEKEKFFTGLKNLHLVSVSNWLDDLVGQSFLHEQHHLVIHNGIDTEAFSPAVGSSIIRQKLHIADDDVMLLGVASVWSERKGLKDFIELSKHLTPKQKIVLIGVTQKQKDSLPPEIIGISRTESAKELAEIYSAANIVLNLSVEETFGMTTVEGFACGTPGIVYNATASPELMNDEVGFIVQPHNIVGLIDTINRVYATGKEKYLNSCREYALKYFRQEDCFQKYIKLYQEIVEKR